MQIDRETQLYEPEKRLIEKNGYTVKAEVEDCDIAAFKGDEILVVEMKRQFNLKVVYQAMERRTITDKVYIAVPRPKRYNDKNTRMMRKMLSELGIGLIAVGVDGPKIAEFIAEPNKTKNINPRKKQRLIKEADGRKTDMNVGGSTRSKIITAYTEASVLALCHMERFDTLNTRNLKKLGYTDKIRNAFRSNAYGWFEKVDTATYAMSEKGILALDAQENKELVEYYRKEVNKNV
jgi:hypothetical protein